jgi:hypothetical protein
MKLGMTGSRGGMNAEARDALIKFLDNHVPTITEVHHGDCVGADAEFHALALGRGYTIIVHPPYSDSQRAFCKADMVLPRLGYLQRNNQIVKKTDAMVAIPNTSTEVVRSGTWATIRTARALNRPLAVILPNGDLL